CERCLIMASRHGVVDVDANRAQSQSRSDTGVRTLDVQVVGSVATVTFDRPKERNGVTPRMVTEMYDVLDALSTEGAISVVVLTGAGATFCPGADLNRDADSSTAEPVSLPDVTAYQSSTLLHEMP